jgi:hypothetical protein
MLKHAWQKPVSFPAAFKSPSMLMYPRLSARMYLQISSTEWLDAISSSRVGVWIP